MACECGFVAGAGYGLAPYGLFPYGLATPEDGLALTGEAVLLAANLAAVTFSGALGLPNPGNESSPLNARNWQLVPQESGATVRLVQFVDVVTEETLPQFVDDLPLLGIVTLPAFLVSFDGVLDPEVVYRVDLTAPAVQLTGCGCAEVVGLVLRRDAVPTDARDGQPLLDIANPFLSRDALRLPAELGAYQLDDRGDFGLDRSEEAGLRKRVFRRVSTASGAFFHLPNYGASPKLKGLLTVDAIERLAARIRAQVLLEPDVIEARVSIHQIPSAAVGAISVSTRVMTASGEPIDVVVPISLP